MDDGCKCSNGMKLATNNFTLNEVKNLSLLINLKYNLNTTINSAGYPNQYVIYISNKDKLKIWSIVKNYIHPSMKYKFGI